MGADGMVALRQWAHVALARAGGSLRLWVDGAQTGSTYALPSGYDLTATGFAIGALTNNAEPVTGYMDGLRLTLGAARYTLASFDLPTAPWPTSARPRRATRARRSPQL